MAGVLIDISMSLDGYVAGPYASQKQPLGEGGQRLQDWLHDGFGERDQEILEELKRTIGAIVMGRRSFDLLQAGVQVDWPTHVPTFVVTSRPPAEVSADRPFTFVDDMNAALGQARDAAGDALISSHGAAVAQQLLAADAVDEVQIHLVPTTLGAGVQLFAGAGARRMEMVRTRVVEAEAATHIRYRVVR